MSAYRIAAITDEFTPQDLEAALRGMADVGMTGAELRVVGGKNMIDLSDDEIDRVRSTVAAHGMEVVGLASPLLKCVLPDSPPLDSRVQHDVFGSAHTFEDQPRLTKRAFEIADPFVKAYFDLLPINESLRRSEFPTIHAYLKVTLCNVHDDLTKRMDGPSLVAALLGTGGGGQDALTA